MSGRTNRTPAAGWQLSLGVATEMLMEQVVDRANMRRARKRVKSNRGAPGVDQVTVEVFPAIAREAWPQIRSAPLEGRYQPHPVRRVAIPKASGGERALGGRLSPLLANVLLDELDRELERGGAPFCTVRRRCSDLGEEPPRG